MILRIWVFRHLYMLVPGWFMFSLLTFYFCFLLLFPLFFLHITWSLFLFGFFLVLFSGYIFRLPGFSWWVAGLVYSAFLFVKRFRASDWISDRSIKTIRFLFFISFPFHSIYPLLYHNLLYPFPLLYCTAISAAFKFMSLTERFCGGVFFFCPCLSRLHVLS